MNALWVIPVAIVALGVGTFLGTAWCVIQYDRWLTRRAQRRAGWWS